MDKHMKALEALRAETEALGLEEPDFVTIMIYRDTPTASATYQDPPERLAAAGFQRTRNGSMTLRTRRDGVNINAHGGTEGDMRR